MQSPLRIVTEALLEYFSDSNEEYSEERVKKLCESVTEKLCLSGAS